MRAIKTLALTLALAMACSGQLCLGAPGVDAKQAQAEPCLPGEGLNYICGPVASEDLVRVPRSRWLIASGLNVGTPAHLYLVDTKTKSAAAVFPTPGTAVAPAPQFRDLCPTPLDPAVMSMDGLALGGAHHGVYRLLAANHGGRMSVEIFDLDARHSRPTLRWVGCVPLPAGNLPNAVAALEDGGFLVISFHDPEDPEAWHRMARGENTGRIFAWHPGQALTELPNSETSGGNGLAMSRDGKSIYASAWSGRRIVVLSTRTGARREIALDFMPDNLHRLSDGTLLVGGQRTSVAAIASCAGPQCIQPWVIAQVNPDNGEVRELLARDGSPDINYACGAIAVDDTLFITARGDRRIAYVPFDGLGQRPAH